MPCRLRTARRTLQRLIACTVRSMRLCSTPVELSSSPFQTHVQAPYYAKPTTGDQNVARSGNRGEDDGYLGLIVGRAGKVKAVEGYLRGSRMLSSCQPQSMPNMLVQVHYWQMRNLLGLRKRCLYKYPRSVAVADEVQHSETVPIRSLYMKKKLAAW